mgnify:CR=1 FL=1
MLQNVNNGEPIDKKSKRVFIDNSIAGILTSKGRSQKLGENNPISNLRTSLNDLNPKSSVQFSKPAEGGGETERNNAIKREL